MVDNLSKDLEEKVKYISIFLFDSAFTFIKIDNSMNFLGAKACAKQPGSLQAIWRSQIKYDERNSCSVLKISIK